MPSNYIFAYSVKDTMINLSQDLSLKKVIPEDHKQLMELMSEIYIASYNHIWSDDGKWYLEEKYNLETFKKEIEDSSNFYYFVYYKQTNIGILKYDFPMSPEIIDIPNSLRLHRIYIKKEYQGKGIAAKLMKWVESVARERRLDYIWLDVMDTQAQAQRFYRKFGFEWIFTYHLDYEKLLPKYRGIQILRKSLHTNHH